MSLFYDLVPIKRFGRDKVDWWIGEIAAASVDDPNIKEGYRYKVRIIGDHTREEPTIEDLPWAVVMMPVTAPIIPGNTGGVSPLLEIGVWVTGIYLDEHRQRPLILGSIGGLAGATKVLNQRRPDTLPFTTAISDEVDPWLDGAPIPENPLGGFGVTESTPELRDARLGDYYNHSVGVLPQSIKDLGFGKSIPPIERVVAFDDPDSPYFDEWCQETANKCGPKDIKSSINQILKDLFGEMNDNSGNVEEDDNIILKTAEVVDKVQDTRRKVIKRINKATGELNDLRETVRRYIVKIGYIIEYFIAKVKGFIKETVANFIETLIKKIIKPSGTGNILTPITVFFNKILAKVDCAMEDLGERLAKWLTDLLFSFVEQIYKSTFCQVDKVVEGILSQIYNLADIVSNEVLGTIETIGDIIVNPGNIVKVISQKILKLLGITCSSPKTKCEKGSTICVNGARDKGDEEDSLDSIIDAIDNLLPNTGTDYQKYVCDDAKTGSNVRDTVVDVVGGVPRQIERNIIVYNMPREQSIQESKEVTIRITRGRYTDVASSINFKTIEISAEEGVDYDPIDGTITFAAGETTKEVVIDTFYNVVNTDSKQFALIISLESPENSDTIFSAFRNDSAVITITKHPITNDPNNPAEFKVDPNKTREILQNDEIIAIAEDDEEEKNNPEQPFDPTLLPPDEVENPDDADEIIPDIPPRTVRYVTDDGTYLIREEPVIIPPARTEILPDPAPKPDLFVDVPITLSTDIQETKVEIDINNRDEEQIPTFNITTTKSIYAPGEIIVFEITTANVKSGQAFNYSLIGSEIESSDIVNGVLSNTFQIIDNKSSVVVGLEEKEETVEKTLTFNIDGVGVNHSVLIKDSNNYKDFLSKTVVEEDDENTIRDFTVNPTTIITDEEGSIIDIPIDDPGEIRYAEAPYVFVTGNGYGATAELQLGPEGLPQYIRINSGGIGYKIQTQDTRNKVCVLEELFVIKPGLNYQSEPEIYINGDKSIARAIIDDGLVIGAEIVDKRLRFDRLPEVKVIGGGGYGARLFPSLSCVDIPTYQRLTSVGGEIRKGVYIDCV